MRFDTFMHCDTNNSLFRYYDRVSQKAELIQEVASCKHTLFIQKCVKVNLDDYLPYIELLRIIK